MLGLHLRQEFRDEQMATAATAFHAVNGSGALDMAPAAFLDITYPSLDVQRGLRAIGTATGGRPVVLFAERGRGKTHVMATLHHALHAPQEAEAWLHRWMQRSDVNLTLIQDVHIRTGYLPITVSMQDNDYELLWDVLFRNHPNGQRFAGRFEESGGQVPPRLLIEDMLTTQPTALILDELQTWYDGRTDQTGKSGAKYRSWAFNFIQTLAEIASDRPDLLLFITSVLKNTTEAFQQIQRNTPVIIDFRDPEARTDRQRLVLHRLFENRVTVPLEEIASATQAYRAERFRLLVQKGNAAGQGESDAAVYAAWPYTPELFTLLEDQILRSNNAQGLRDLLRVLADTFRVSGASDDILSPVHFNITAAESRNVDALLDAIASQTQHKLREVAKRNYDGLLPVLQGIRPTEVAELMSAIWMRSFAAEAQVGATAAQLHLDMTHANAIDANAFNDLLNQVVTSAFNIYHSDGDQRRYYFREDENARAVIMARARNDQLFSEGQDITFLRQFIRTALSPNSPGSARVVVLGPAWETAPWDGLLSEDDRPERWNGPIMLVLPTTPKDINATLGRWLARHVLRRRNTLRYLLPDIDLFADNDVCQMARLCELVTRWDDQKFAEFRSKFRQDLTQKLEGKYTRFAFLKRWNYQDPARCAFTVEPLREPLQDIGKKVDTILLNDCFLQDEFGRRAVALTANQQRVGELLDGLLEPPGDPQQDALVYLSERDLNEQLLQLVAHGTISLFVDGAWVTRQTGQSTADALKQVQRVGYRNGRELRDMLLGPPDVVGAGTLGGASPSAIGSLFTPPPAPVDPPAPPPSYPGAGPMGGAAWPRPAPITPPAAALGEDATPAYGTPKSRQRRVRRSPQPKRPINLTGELEQWGIDVRATIPVARLEFTGISAAQLKNLLSRLPVDVQAVLEVETDEEVQG